MKKILRVPVLFLLIASYIVYHILSGHRSVFVYLDKKAAIEKKLSELREIREKADALSNKIRRLQDHAIDPDLLEEEARLVLGESETQDMVLVK